MTDPRIPLKNPILAGILAFLIPGAGHFYQGRLFKAGIYFVCILGLFFSGMAMADWQAVKPPVKGERRLLEKAKYVGQLGVGLPAMYGIIQRERYSSEGNRRPETISSDITAPFEGIVNLQEEDGFSGKKMRIEGEILLVPDKAAYGGNTISGTITGEIDGQPETLQLAPSVDLDKPIKASWDRGVQAEIIDQKGGHRIGYVEGNIPRSFLNWFEVPMDDHEVQDLHRRLGKYHELAMVFTWVAGFLNVLAIWDAVEGPAYGFDDHLETGTTPPEEPPTVA